MIVYWNAAILGAAFVDTFWLGYCFCDRRTKEYQRMTSIVLLGVLIALFCVTRIP